MPGAWKDPEGGLEFGLVFLVPRLNSPTGEGRGWRPFAKKKEIPKSSSQTPPEFPKKRTFPALRPHDVANTISNRFGVHERGAQRGALLSTQKSCSSETKGQVSPSGAPCSSSTADNALATGGVQTSPTPIRRFCPPPLQVVSWGFVGRGSKE